MENKQIKVANNDVIGVTIAKMTFAKANEEGLLVDDEGKEYRIDRFGTYVGREFHPAEALHANLQRELESVAFERLQAEEKEKRKSTSPWALGR